MAPRWAINVCRVTWYCRKRVHARHSDFSHRVRHCADFIEPQQISECFLMSDALILAARVNPHVSLVNLVNVELSGDSYMRAVCIVTRTKSRLVASMLALLFLLGGLARQASAIGGEFIPTGKQITPTAATGLHLWAAESGSAGTSGLYRRSSGDNRH
jgi:hypothetical protein